jgi:DNA-directed RNA polymerase subunit M/transcription elongation factor TFIIS
MENRLLKIKNPEKFRNNVMIKINKLLNDEKKSLNVEKSIFNFSIKEATNMKIVKKWDNEYFVLIYFNRFKSIFINLNKKNNKLLEKIINGEITNEDLCNLTHQEMFPEHWTEIIKEKIKMDKKIFDEKKIESMSDLVKCKKCKGRECTYYELQTRSCDEPATQYYTCLICDNKWKQ